jgi:hypothetical protein
MCERICRYIRRSILVPHASMSNYSICELFHMRTIPYANYSIYYLETIPYANYSICELFRMRNSCQTYNLEHNIKRIVNHEVREHNYD